MQRLERAWQEAPLVWLAGVRRAGKTVLAKEFSDSEFLNCDLPGNVWRLEDPEAFFKSVGKPLVVLDEVHQLPDPSRILKIATDAFPHLRVLATGSSNTRREPEVSGHAHRAEARGRSHSSAG
jgi:predicted AAA+ superfamily ATPase